MVKALAITAWLMVNEPQVPVEISQIIGQQVVFCAGVFEIEASIIMGVMEVESHFNGYAVSKRGARGLMQVRDCFHHGEGNSIHGSIFHGTRVLKEMLDKNGGDLELALRKYNGSKDGRYIKKVRKAILKWQSIVSRNETFVSQKMRQLLESGG